MSTYGGIRKLMVAGETALSTTLARSTFGNTPTVFTQTGASRKLDPSARLLGLTLDLHTLAGAPAPTLVTWYLHGFLTGDTTQTHRKYTEPVTSTIRVDATDATKGVVHYTFDDFGYLELDALGPLSQLHWSVNQGTAVGRAFLRWGTS